ncbi:MAG: hypothetical protein HKN81_01890 [Gammaproteobacteria bacterium]|nr:hypothetical protein [Gammaproteobacteria bacterium]
MITATFAYDNLVLASGHLIGLGEPLEFLTRYRYAFYVINAALFPLAAARIAAAAGLESMLAGPWRNALMLTMLLMFGYGMWFALSDFDLAPSCYEGIVRYSVNVPVNQLCFADQEPLIRSGVPLNGVLSHILVTILGAAILGKRRWPWLFVASMTLFAADKLPPVQFDPAVTNAAMICWLIGFVASSQRFASSPIADENPLKPTFDFDDTSAFATRVSEK